jgi:hypothetical protein
MTKLFGFTLFIAATVIYGQQSALDSQSMHEQHMHEQLTTEKAMADHHDGINDQAMGFSHEINHSPFFTSERWWRDCD